MDEPFILFFWDVWYRVGRTLKEVGMDLLTDNEVRKALADMGTECVQMLSVQGGVCGEQLSVGIVNQPNLLCDRFLVGTCTAGHQRLVSIVE